MLRCSPNQLRKRTGSLSRSPSIFPRNAKWLAPVRRWSYLRRNGTTRYAKLVLEDLVKERGALCSSLLQAIRVRPRSDFIDCWNLLDEIAEHDRRIETSSQGHGRDGAEAFQQALTSPAGE